VKPTRVYELALAAKTTATLAMIVEDDWDDGEFDIELSNHYGTEKIGRVHVRRFPISIKLDGGDALKLGLVDGTTTRVLLRNEDPLTYPISWRLVNGEDICSGKADLAPKMSAVLECTPRLKLRASRLTNLLKPDASHGAYHLFLTPQSYQTAPQPMKTFAGEVTLDYFRPLTRGIATYVILIGLLIAGGVSSLLLSYSLPNKLQRLDLQDKLIDLAAKTADLSTRIESRLSVLVRLERSRLTDLLSSRSTLLPDFSTVASQCESGITRLASKVAVLEQMDMVLGRLLKKLSEGVPPSQVDKVNAHLKDVAVRLGKSEVTDADVQAANTAVAEASTKVDKLNEPDDEFGRQLANTTRQLLLDLNNPTLATSPTYLRFIAQLSGPNVALRAVNPADQIIVADKYVDLDTAVQKMHIIRDYVSLKDGAGDQAMKARLEARESELIALMQTKSWHALNSARSLLHEMEDDIFPERLLEALQNPGEVSIEMDPSVAYERSPLEFSVYFHKSALNTAAAREQLTVEWDFGDGLGDKGWIVSHYFQIRGKQNEYNVRARFHDPDGETVTDKNGEPITITRTVKASPSELGRGFGERTLAEALKLGAALLIAVFGLVSGAQDQIAKLDVLPGLVATFLVGFSADSIKRLLATTKSPAAQ